MATMNRAAILRRRANAEGLAGSYRRDWHRSKAPPFSSFSLPLRQFSFGDSSSSRDDSDADVHRSIISCQFVEDNHEVNNRYGVLATNPPSRWPSSPLFSLSTVETAGHRAFLPKSAGGIVQSTREVRTEFLGMGQNSAIRPISSIADMLPQVPEFAQNLSVWGASGYILKALHADGAVPYWACMSLTNILVRSSLVPLVINSAHTQTRFAGVAPEVQFLVSCFQKDSKKLKEGGAPLGQRVDLAAKTFQTLKAIYKIRKVSPFDIFKSPLMQIPVFWYFSIDIRKIINGGDPELAQQLTESGMLWVTDLTEPDPWYGLPILGGLLLYANVEIAMGKKTLSGETTSKSNMAVILKDVFQSLAVFMPCFMSHNPAGVQIYLATSFVFTAAQGAALRSDGFRQMVGLPAMNAPAPEPVLVKEFLDMNKEGIDAAEERKSTGDDAALGSGVLYPGFQTAFSGSAKPSTIKGSAGLGPLANESGTMSSGSKDSIDGMPGIEQPNLNVGTGVLQPHMLQLPDDRKDEPPQKETSSEAQQREVMEQIPEGVMEAANRGEMLPPPAVFAPEKKRAETTKIDARSLAQKKKQKRGGKKVKKKSQSKRPSARRK